MVKRTLSRGKPSPKLGDAKPGDKKKPTASRDAGKIAKIIDEAQAWQNSSSVRELRQTLRNILDLAHGRPVGSGG